MLDGGEDAADLRRGPLEPRRPAEGDGHPDERVCLVNGAVGLDAQIGLAAPRPVAEAGGAVVAGPGVDAGQLDHRDECTSAPRGVRSGDEGGRRCEGCWLDGCTGRPHRRLRFHLWSGVLAARGIEGSAAAFLGPKLSDLHDPSAMPDLDRAAERLLDAMARRERIAIYGDYDVDGITATAILFHMIRAIAPDTDIQTYVPHRLEEGYGLNVGAIEELAASGVKLIVSVGLRHHRCRTGSDRETPRHRPDHHRPPQRAGR